LIRPPQPDPERSTITIRTHRCGSWWCPYCCRRKAGIARRSLLGAVKSWRRPLLLTLSVDRHGVGYHGEQGRSWTSAKEVHDEVATKSLVARLMQRMGVERWVWVLEFQSKTGEGWPHWHVLLDAPGSGWFDFAEARRLWWGTWGIGNIDVKIGIGANGGVFYLTSYMTKVAATPQWVLASSKTTRKVGASKAVGSIMRHRPAGADDEPSLDHAEEGSTPVEHPEPPIYEKPRHEHPVLWRLAECGQSARMTINEPSIVDHTTWLHLDARSVMDLVDPGAPNVVLTLDNPSVLRIELPSVVAIEAMRKIAEAAKHAEPAPIWTRAVDQAYARWEGAIGSERLDSDRIPNPPWLGYQRDEVRRREGEQAESNAGAGTGGGGGVVRKRPTEQQARLFSEWRSYAGT